MYEDVHVRGVCEFSVVGVSSNVSVDTQSDIITAVKLRRNRNLSHCASQYYSELRKMSLSLLLRLLSFVV